MHQRAVEQVAAQMVTQMGGCGILFCQQRGKVIFSVTLHLPEHHGKEVMGKLFGRGVGDVAVLFWERRRLACIGAGRLPAFPGFTITNPIRVHTGGSGSGGCVCGGRFDLAGAGLQVVVDTGSEVVVIQRWLKREELLIFDHPPDAP